MSMLFKFLGLLSHGVGFTLAAIVSYHVTIVAAPAWLTMWWISLVLAGFTLLFYAVGQFADRKKA